MDPSEPACSHQKGPTRPKHGTIGRREVTLLDRFPAIQDRRRHLDHDWSKFSAIFQKVRRRPLGSKGGAREETPVRMVPTDIAAKLREMLGPSMRRKASSEGFAVYGIRLNKRYREPGQALKRLDNTLGASKLFHPVIRGILLLENSGLDASEASAVLATQENSYDYACAMSGLEEWPKFAPVGSLRQEKPRTLRRWLVL